MSNVAKIEKAEVMEIEAPSISSNAMILNDGNFTRIVKFAELMSTAAVSVPTHLRGKPGDCLAIVMQATQWKMNPFAVAQKTHFVNGGIGYEAQLVNAVVQESGAITGRFSYEYRGEGSKLECRVGAVIRGERDITWGEWLSLDSVAVKNSPLWKTNPKQQLGYLQIKNWARAYTPGAILGVYTPDELERRTERDMGNAEVVTPSRDEPKQLPEYPQEQFDKNLPAWHAAIKAGKVTAEQIVARASSKYVVTQSQRDQLDGVVNAPAAEPEQEAPAAEGSGERDPWLDEFDGENK